MIRRFAVRASVCAADVVDERLSATEKMGDVSHLRSTSAPIYPVCTLHPAPCTLHPSASAPLYPVCTLHPLCFGTLVPGLHPAPLCFGTLALGVHPTGCTLVHTEVAHAV